MKELYPYGQCQVCGGEIVIPGLEAFLCGGQCARWIRRERTGWTQIEASPAKTTVTRPKKTVNRKGLTPQGRGAGTTSGSFERPPFNGDGVLEGRKWLPPTTPRPCTPHQTASLSVNQPSLLEQGGGR